MPLDIVYEDAEILVLDKPAGLVVHPGAGNPDLTLMNALLAHAPALAGVPRAGIVHRLDKDTSGLLVGGENADRADQPRAPVAGAHDGPHLHCARLGQRARGQGG